MKHIFSRLGMATCLLSTLSTGYAVDVIVNSTLPEVAGVSYQTINNALNYVKTQAEPRTVRITGGGPYIESPLVNFSVTIRGEGIKPVIVTPGTSGGPASSVNGNGISFFTTADFPGEQTFWLENVTIIPAVGSSVVRGIRTNNNATGLSTDKMHLNLVDVVITANNGSNQPVSTSGLDAVNLAGATTFTDDGMFTTGFIDVALTGTVITHNQGSVTPDGIVFFPDTPGFDLHIGPGTVISYNKRAAIQMARDGNDLDMVGSEAEPIVIKGNFANNPTTRNPAIAIFIDSQDDTSIVYDIQNVVFLENNSRVFGGWAVNDNQSAPPMNVDHVAFVGNGEATVYLADDLDGEFNFSNSTWVNNGGAAASDSSLTYIFPIISVSDAILNPGSTGSINFTDCVIAGDGTTGDVTTGKNLIELNTTLIPVSFINSALPTAGPHRLGTDIFKLGSGALAPIITNVKNEDPQFELVSSAFSDPNFLDVKQTAYDNAGTGGSDLSGYGDFEGATNVGNWSIY